jgi:hypothetical protein
MTRPTVLLLALAIAPTVSAGPITRRLVREGGANAVLIHGEPWTLADLIDRRDEHPRRFDAQHPRLGAALRLGEDGLTERRDRNPQRFDFHHPFLGHLLADTTPDVLMPPPKPPGVPTPNVQPPPTPTPGVPVPEPATWAMLAVGLVAMVVVRGRGRR